MEKTISAMEARKNFGRLLEETHYQGNVFVIQRATKPMAALIPLEQYQQWQLRREEFFALIDKAQERTGQLSPSELEETIAEAVQVVKSTENSSSQTGSF
ncbi:type II toxin-antitoxin system Phd/YefM family antitoxin [Chloroflexota bacterium]